MSDNKVNISKQGFENLINQVLANANEERNLALDRYRTQDEQIQTLEDFMAIGKDAVSYLKLASERTNLLITIADKVKDIVYKVENNDNDSSDGNISDALRKQIEATIDAQNKKKQDDDLTQGLEAND